MILALAGLARAASYTNVLSVMDLCDTVAAGLDADDDNTFAIAGDHDTDCESLAIDGAERVTFVASYGAYALPPLSLSGGAEVTIEVATFPGAAATDLLASVAGSLPTGVGSAAIGVVDATLQLDGVTFDGTAGAGVVVYGGTLGSSDATFTDFDTLRAVYVLAGDVGATVDLEGLHAADNDAGAVYLAGGAAQDVDATIGASDFAGDAGPGADVLADDVRSVVLDGVTIDGSVATRSEASAFDGAPLAFRGSHAQLVDVEMTGTRGEDGSLVSIDARAPHERYTDLAIEGGRYSPAGAGGTALWAYQPGGTIELRGASFEEDPAHPFGALYLSAPAVTVAGNTLTGAGATTFGTAILVDVVSAALADVSDNTFCGWDPGADGDLAVLYAANSIVHAERNVFVDLAATAIVSNANTSLYAIDDTFVGVGTAVAVSGGDLVFYNDLVAYSDVGVAFVEATDVEEGHHNLWFENGEDVRDLPWGFESDGTSVSADPTFRTPWPGGGCGWSPEIAAASPANGGGVDGEDAYGERPTDIGALDVAAGTVDTGVVPPDTGDTAPHADTADSAPPADDSGAIDTSTGGDDSAPPPDAGAPTLVGLSGGRACGCDGDGDGAFLLLPLLARRRRP